MNFINFFLLKVRVFHNSDGLTHSDLWDITWTRVGVFLPQLKEELFKNERKYLKIMNLIFFYA